IHDVPARLADLLVGKSVTGKRPGLEILDEYIAMPGHPAHQFLSFATRNVHGDRFLAAVCAGEISRLDSVPALRILDVGRTPAAGVVARPGALYLDHLSAEIGERLRGHRPGQHSGQIQHADSAQWPCHFSLTNNSKPQR